MRYSRGGEEVKEYLGIILRINMVIGIFSIALGVPLSENYLSFMYGQKWLSDTCIRSLQLYCVYELIMGVNGVFDCYVNSSILIRDMGNLKR